MFTPLFFTVVQVSRLFMPPGFGWAPDPMALEVLRSIEQPVERRFYGDRRWAEFDKRLTTAMNWPHPAFCGAFLRMLDSADPDLAWAAAVGLVNYHEPMLRERVARLTSDNRCLGPEGRDVLGHRISRLLATDRAHVPCQPLPAKEGLLPLDDGGGWDQGAAGICAFPQALDALHNESPSVQIQAFTWLLRVGVVTDVRVLELAWMKMSDAERAALLEPDYVRMVWWGSERLEATLANVITATPREQMSETTLTNVLLTLGYLRSVAGRTLGLALIDEHIKTAGRSFPRVVEDEDAICLSAAFLAVAATADDRDVEGALEWSRSPDQGVRAGGLWVLAHLDEPRAVDVVVAFLSRAASFDDPLLPDPLDALERREWNHESTRWRYISSILSTLEEQLASEKRERVTILTDRSTKRPLSRYVQCLEAIAQTSNGPVGLSKPPELVLNVGTLRKTAERWRAWLETNNAARMVPSRSPASSYNDRPDRESVQNGTRKNCDIYCAKSGDIEIGTNQGTSY